MRTMWEQGRRDHKARGVRTGKGRRSRALLYSTMQAVAARTGDTNRSRQVARVSPKPYETSCNIVTDLDMDEIEKRKGKPEREIDSSR